MLVQAPNVFARIGIAVEIAKHIADICYTIPFAGLQAHCARLIAGGVRGRAVVTFG